MLALRDTADSKRVPLPSYRPARLGHGEDVEEDGGLGACGPARGLRAWLGGRRDSTGAHRVWGLLARQESFACEAWALSGSAG